MGGRRLSYANVTATLALVFAMSGGALAASHYLINSTGQINPKVLKALRGTTGTPGATGPSGTAGATGAQGGEGPPGKDGAEGKPGLAGKDGVEGKAGKEGKEGPPGKEGQPGKEGKEGPPAKLGAIVGISGKEVKVEPGKTGEAKAECPVGSHAISGGFSLLGEKPTTPGPNFVTSQAQPERQGWIVSIANSNATESIYIDAVAYCAKEGEAVGG